MCCVKHKLDLGRVKTRICHCHHLHAFYLAGFIINDPASLRSFYFKILLRAIYNS